MDSIIDFNKITACGGCCDDCSHFKNETCTGCINNGGSCVKMWANGCEIFKCCKEHNVPFCGLCSEFPCEWIKVKIGEWNPTGIEELLNAAVQYRGRKES